MHSKRSHLKQFRRLGTLLLISGGTNIVLIGALCYWGFIGKPYTAYFDSQPIKIEKKQTSLAINHTNHEVLRKIEDISFEELVHELTHTDLIENGYSYRDLALAILVTCHQFDITRALRIPTEALPQRSFAYQKQDGTKIRLTSYPSLTNEQFQLITHFAAVEKWPFTNEKIFSLLQLDLYKQDQSLIETFCLTAEFQKIYAVFQALEPQISHEELLSVTLECNWKLLANFQATHGTNEANRQAFLLCYVEQQSKAAANLLLKTDFAFAAKKLDDGHVISLLNLLTERSPLAAKYALAVATSPRSLEACALASTRLNAMATPGTQPIACAQKPKPIVASVKVSTVKPLSIATNEPKKMYSKRNESTYLVSQGDNLWKISRRFNVNIDIIKAYNGLQDNALKPGTALRIPLS